MVKIIGNGQGGTDWNNLGATIASALTGGDQLGAALKRAQLGAETERGRGLRMTNDGVQSAIDLARTDSLGNLFGSGNREYQAAITGASGGDISKLIEMARAQTAYNPANTELTDMTSRSQIAAGAPMSSTVQGFNISDNTTRRGQDVSAATSRANNADTIANQRFEFLNKPVEAMVTPQADPNAIGPNTPASPEARYVRQGDAFNTGVAPIMKNGMSITTNPDGTMSFTQGGTLPKPTEQQIRATGIAQEMMPGIAVLNRVYSGDMTMSNAGAAAMSMPGFNTPLGQNIAQGTGAIDQNDQMILGAMESIMNNLYIKTGAARTASEDRNELMSMIPLSTDTPERREFKRAQFNQKAMAVIMASRDPSVRAQLTEAMAGNFQPAYPNAQPLGQPSQAQPAAPGGVDANLLQYMTPEERALFQ